MNVLKFPGTTKFNIGDIFYFIPYYKNGKTNLEGWAERWKGIYQVHSFKNTNCFGGKGPFIYLELLKGYGTNNETFLHSNEDELERSTIEYLGNTIEEAKIKWKQIKTLYGE